MKPQTRYANSNGLNIAYQVVGSGPVDLVFVMGWVSHCEFMWTEPHFRRFLERLASFSRLILLDKRGTGLSDRPVDFPTLEQRMDDLRAVMDAVGSEQAVLVGVSEGAPMCVLFAATYPERTSSIVLFGGYATQKLTEDHPWGRTPAHLARYWNWLEQEWGSDLLLDQRAPSMSGDETFRDWWSSFLRMSASPGAALKLSRMNHDIDVRDVLPSVCVPTLVLHREHDRAVELAAGKYLAEHIPGAQLEIVPGQDHLPFIGNQDEVLDHIERFATGKVRSPHVAEGRLITILSGELVGAAARSASLDADAWQAFRSEFWNAMRSEIVQHQGEPVEQRGARILATFDGSARAVHCARRLTEVAGKFQASFRCGLHIGEFKAAESGTSGATALIAERVMSGASANSVLLTSTLVDLVAGAGFSFRPSSIRIATSTGRNLELFEVSSASAPLQMVEPQVRDFEVSLSSLSPREQEVAVLIAQGLSNRLIAEALSISTGTVDRHTSNIFNKLGFHSRAQVAFWAAEQGLVGHA